MLKPYWRTVSKGRPEYGKDGFKKYFAGKRLCAACPAHAGSTPAVASISPID
jgi:hypothetical protein